MTKKLTILAGIIIIAVFAFIGLNNDEETSTPAPIPVQDVLGVPEDDFPQTISNGERKFSAFWHSPSIENVILIPNYEPKLTSNEVIEQQECKFLTNGGFYDEERKPLGLVVSGSQQINPTKQSSLFNGIFSINSFIVPRITTNMPEDNLAIAVQSGPRLFKNGQKTDITVENDKNARRSVVAVTGENKLIFLHITGTNNSYDGPTLEELPTLIENLNSEYKLGIADALNLDGGAASLYISGDTRIKEISLPGAYFCER